MRCSTSYSYFTETLFSVVFIDVILAIIIEISTRSRNCRDETGWKFILGLVLDHFLEKVGNTVCTKISECVEIF